MIEVYKQNKDLHSETAGSFKGFSYEKMMEMKNSPDSAIQEFFKELRQLGKAGNPSLPGMRYSRADTTAQRGK